MSEPNLDLGVIGNCSFGALIDRRARVVWSCLPTFDGDPAFCRLEYYRDLAALERQRRGRKRRAGTGRDVTDAASRNQLTGNGLSPIDAALAAPARARDGEGTQDQRR